MTTITTALLALTIFLVSFVLGRHTARRHYEIELRNQVKRLQRVIDFADDHIERTAPQRALIVLRDTDGHIVELAMRCGTPTIAARELLEEHRRQKSLH